MDKQKLKISIISSFIILIGIIVFIIINNYEKKDELIIKNNTSNNVKKEITNNNISINKFYWKLFSQTGNINIKNEINYYKEKNDIEKVSFLSSFIWDYKNAVELRNKICINDKKSNLCKNKKININYTNKELKDFKVSISWWNFSTWSLYTDFYHRIKLSKKWYLDVFEKVFLLENSNNNIDIWWKTIKSTNSIISDNNKNISYKTKNFKYEIDANSFVDSKWNLVNWNIEIFFFDIWASDWDLSVLNQDAFDENWILLWTSMTTLWMPLVKAYLWDEELTLIKEIKWTWIIQNLERSPWIDLNNVPKNQWLNSSELSKYKIAPFWHLDNINWIWITSKMKILDSKWNYEFKLY